MGEPIAAIISETRAQGVDAAEMVIVDYDPLPVVVDVEQAASNDTLLFPEAGTNDAVVVDGRSGMTSSTGAKWCSPALLNQRLAPCPMETRACIAEWGDDGRVTAWTSSQGPHAHRSAIAKILGIDEENVRVISPDVGGGFGAKASISTEEMLLPWIAKRIGRPVRWVETRTESMLTLGHGRGQLQEVEIGGTRDGTIEAYRLHVTADAGGYALVGAVLPFLTRVMLTGVYKIPKADFSAVSRVTNTTPTVAYRGAGRPEATAAIERAVDLFSVEIGMDPAEVRRKNLVSADAFPFTTPMGTEYDTGDYERALDLPWTPLGTRCAKSNAPAGIGDVKRSASGCASM